MSAPRSPSEPCTPLTRLLAVGLVAVTFPLVWVGGLVTTYDAGLAVPDWPNTYGYNLLAYPWSTWINGPWELFIEHGHRLLGAAAGLVALCLAVVAWRRERPAVRALALAALALVIVQGLLGGLRVVLTSRQLALAHGCLGPAFFALTLVLAAVASRRWHQLPDLPAGTVDPLRRLALVTALLAYVQLVLGAQLRHVGPMASPGQFQFAVALHLVGAVLLAAHAAAAMAVAARLARRAPRLAWLAAGLLSAVAGQLVLGAGTWITRYGVPSWLVAALPWGASYTVQAEGRAQTLWTNSHVVTGSLILGLAVLLAARTWCLARGALRGTAGRPFALGVFA